MKRFLERMFGTGSARTQERKSNPARRPRRVRPESPLRVEGLEERLLLSVQPEFHVNTKVGLDQYQPEVACSADVSPWSRQCVIVWTDQYNSTGDYDIRAQIYSYRIDSENERTEDLPGPDQAMLPRGGEIIVAFSTRPEGEPSVAVDPQGNFVVVWTEIVNGANSDIRARRYFADGTPNGGVISVTTGSRREYDPAVAIDDSGRFVVSYTLCWSSTDKDVMAKRYASDGSFLYSITVAASGRNEHNAEIAGSPNGRFSIVYQIDRFGEFETTGNSDIQLKRYGVNGRLLGSYAIANSSAGELNPDVAVDNNGNAVVVYEYIQSSQDHDIKARQVFPTGVMSSTIHVDVGHLVYGWYPTREINPRVAMSSVGGNFVVTYQRQYNFTGPLYSPTETYVRQMNAGGSVLSTHYLGTDVADTPEIAVFSDVHPLSQGYFLAYMGNNRPGDPGMGIFSREAWL